MAITLIAILHMQFAQSYMMSRERLYLFVVLAVLCGAIHHCSTEGTYYVRSANVSTCPGQPCHNLSYYNENSHLFFTSNTAFYFLPGEHILQHIIVINVSNITLAGIISEGNTILQCHDEGGIDFIYCKKVHMFHLTVSNCGTYIRTSWPLHGVGFESVRDLEVSNIVVTNSTGFGLFVVDVVGSVHIQNSMFKYNMGSIGGNAAFVYSEGYEFPQVTDTLLHVENSTFAYGESWSPQGASSGGITLFVSQSSYNIDMLVTNTTLIGNQAAMSDGGNLRIHYFDTECSVISVSIEHCHVTQGQALNGGGLFFAQYIATSNKTYCGTRETQYTLHITDTRFENNVAYNDGGNICIYDHGTSVYNHINISNSSIVGGLAQYGAGLKIQMGAPQQTDPMERDEPDHYNTPITVFSEKSYTISNCDIQNNFAAIYGGGVVIGIWDFNHLAQIGFANVRFVGNTITQTSVGGHVSIQDQLGKGGMVFVRFQNIHFEYAVTALEVSSFSADVLSVRQVELWNCTFVENTSLPNSIDLQSFSPHINPATSAFRIIFSNVIFINTPIVVTRLCNVTFINSTFCDSSTSSSLAAISSEVRFQGNIVFKNNTGYDGGALTLFGGSKLILMPQTALLFIGNHAIHAGGAIMVYEPLLFTKYLCFFSTYSNHQNKDIKLIFECNTAEYAGDAIFGGFVQSCEQKALTVHDDEISTLYHWFQKEDNISSLFDIRQEGLSIISSQPYRACLCENDMPNCSRAELTKHLYPGDTFAVSAVAVGQLNGTVPGVVHADFVNSRQSSLSSFQELQRTERVCTTLKYTIYSNAQLASLRLRAENTSRMSGSTLNMREPHISIQFLPCPPGFALGNSGERQLGKCVCDLLLFRLEPNISCNITDQTVYRPSSLWIGQLPQENTSHIIYQLCPFDYCKPKPVNTKLNESDQQCNFNRSGILCGACRTTYSLMLGGSQCSKCNGWYELPVLLVAFAIFGVLLVVFLTLCNLNVSNGTINGLIFYANIVHTTHSIFFPSEGSLIAPFALFIAWLNLDFGFEVCFYSGMDTYSKTWLQFVFPTYIWLIAFLMVVSSHYSTTAAKLFGRNAVKVLATLFLLSFAKLQRTIISALSFTFLNFLDGSRKNVWVYDGNIDYLEGRHIPLFLAGLLAFLCLLLPYTLVLTFVQCLRRRTGMRTLFWVRRLKPFFDAYTGPYKDKYSFWVGLLLLVRSSLFLVFAFNALGDPALNLLATALTGFLLAILLQGLRGVYKSWPLNTLESLSLLNLGILSLATLYVTKAGGSQTALTCTSVGIAFLTFVAILFYHMTFTRVWRRLMEWYSQRKRCGETREVVPTEMDTIGEQTAQPQVRTVELRFDQYREPLLTDVTS